MSPNVAISPVVKMSAAMFYIFKLFLPTQNVSYFRSKLKIYFFLSDILHKKLPFALPNNFCHHPPPAPSFIDQSIIIIIYEQL